VEEARLRDVLAHRQLSVEQNAQVAGDGGWFDDVLV